MTLAMVDGKVVSSGIRGEEFPTDIVLEGNQLSFTLVRTFRDNPMALKYSGQINGDSIKGGYRYAESKDGYQTFWNAKRVTK